MNHSTPGLPVHHQLPEFTQTHVHRVSDAIQPSHPLSSPSPPAPNPSQHQSLFCYPGLIPGQGTKRSFFMTTHCSPSRINTKSKTKMSGRGSQTRWAMKPQIPYSLTRPGPKVTWGPHLPGRGLNSPLPTLETSSPAGPVDLAEQAG